MLRQCDSCKQDIEVPEKVAGKPGEFRCAACSEGWCYRCQRDLQHCQCGAVAAPPSPSQPPSSEQ